MQISLVKTPIPDLLVLETKILEDERGFFLESYSKRDFENIGINDSFVQENHSRSQKKVLRGLHYQTMQAPMSKLVRCMRGKIFDVAVDIRLHSETFGKWFGIELSEENKKMLYVPIGFAHGFQALTDDAEILYKQTNYYTPEAERSILWKDPEIGITWPIPDPILSEKDKKAMLFNDYRAYPAFS